MMHWHEYHDDQGELYYTADGQALSAQWAMGQIMNDTFYAWTPELKCRDTFCVSLICSICGLDMEEDIADAVIKTGDLAREDIAISLKTDNVKGALSKIGILHEMEAYYGKERTKIHKTTYNNRLVLEVPQCWLKSVCTLSLYCLLLRSFSIDDKKYDNLDEFIASLLTMPRSKDIARLRSIREDLDIPLFMSNLDEIFKDSPITGYNDDEITSDMFEEMANTTDNGDDIDFLACYGISYFITKLTETSLEETNRGYLHITKYKELLDKAKVKEDKNITNK